MKNNSYISKIRKTKILQLITLILIDVIFSIILFVMPSLRNNIFVNQTLTYLCISLWLIMLISLIFLIVDFYLLCKLTMESHHLNQLAYLDDLTSIPNRNSLDLMFKTYHSPESLANIGCCMLSISNLAEINEKVSREAGDIVLRDFCHIFEEIGDSYGFIGRNSGNEFILILEQCSIKKCQDFKDSLNKRLDMYNQVNPGTPIHIQISSILNSEAKIERLDKLLAAASQALYQN